MLRCGVFVARGVLIFHDETLAFRWLSQALKSSTKRDLNLRNTIYFFARCPADSRAKRGTRSGTLSIPVSSEIAE